MLTRLDDMIVRLIGLRTHVDDPDRLVRFTLGDDGRLTNPALEKKPNDLLSAGNEAMRLSRKQFWDSVSEGRGSGGPRGGGEQTRVRDYLLANVEGRRLVCSRRHRVRITSGLGIAHLRVCHQPDAAGTLDGGSSAHVTYCIGVMLDNGMIFASDSRTNAGVDNFAKFCKMTVFERRGNRVVVLLSSGNLAGTQAVISVLTQRCADGDAPTNLWGARTMFDVVRLVADAMRDIEKRDAGYLQENNIRFNASFIVGGQIDGEPIRLFRIYAEGNFIEAGIDTIFFQTGETKYGKPILDRVITQRTPLADATKCVLVSFDSTMRSNLSVGMPIDLICYERDSLEVQRRRRFDEGDPYFTALSDEWGDGVRQVFRHLPELRW
jgi:putative proteasome-type protease